MNKACKRCGMFRNFKDLIYSERYQGFICIDNKSCTKSLDKIKRE